MHLSAYKNCQMFFSVYGTQLRNKGTVRVIDIGAQDINGSLRSVVPSDFCYVGMDFAPGKGVDIVLDDPYCIPIDSASVDVVISSSCFEHSEMFWLSFLEIMRILKPHGLFYLNAPSNGSFHRYPVDCWRFYPDAGNALVNWAKRNQLNPVLLESFLSEQSREIWNDFVAVFVKEQQCAGDYHKRIIDEKIDFTNGFTNRCPNVINPSRSPEDIRKLIAKNRKAILAT
jgi:SAM-dependent methyltransferase